MLKIKLLPPHIIKQIAAGEVVESPASIVKELIDNSIDAKATSIEISIRNGGKTFISVLDNGEGIAKEDLRNSLLKHTTSKLDHHNLYNIRTMGFRGEALFSIAYMSKLTIKSKSEGATEAYEVAAESDYISDLKLSNLQQGTYIEVRDLFFSLPARLKFLRSDIAEASAVYKIVDTFAMAYPNIGFRVFNNGKKIIEYKGVAKQECSNIDEEIKESLKLRLNEVLGKDFTDNSLFIYTPSVDFVIYGYCSIPTFTSHSSSKQYLFVNGRSIKEKSFFGALKSAYGGVIEKNRYPLVVVFIDINPEAIDVNVSPSKTEVKFKDLEQIKKFIIASIKDTIANPSLQKTSSRLPQSFISTINKNKLSNNYNKNSKSFSKETNNTFIFNSQPKVTVLREEASNEAQESFIKKQVDNTLSDTVDIIETNNSNDNTTLCGNNIDITNQVIKDNESNNYNSLFPELKLGFAKAQYNKNWVLAESKEGLVIVDQHAAHERISQQRLYDQFINKKVITEMLLLPEVIEITTKDLEVLLEFKLSLEQLGLVIDKFGNNAIIVREYPKILGKTVNLKELIFNILIDLKELETPEFFLMKLWSVIAKMACHGSIRAGDKLSVEEMNELLRQIEVTENSAECPHGRPTYTIISWQDIEKLFSRR